jgi:hypothetical protein
MPTIPTRFPNGISDATETGAHGRYAGLRPARYAEYFNDFYTYYTTDWTLTETAAGSTELVQGASGGILAITNVSAGATDEASIQYAGGSGATITQWTYDSTKDFFMHVRFKVSNATLTAFVIGLASLDTTPVASLPANGIFFNKVAASTALLANLRNTSSSTTVSMGAMADDTYISAAFNYSAASGTWQAFLNDVSAGVVTSPVPPTAPLAVTIGFQNGSALAHVMSVDWIQVSQER